MIALDVTKRVAYARDTAGVVVGRQMLAISKDERLVCFHVYPLQANPSIKRAFREHDRTLAAALQVEIQLPGPKGSSYQLARLHSG